MEIEYWTFGVRHIQLLLLSGMFVVDFILLQAISAIIVSHDYDVIKDPQTIYEDPLRNTLRNWTPVQNTTVFFSSAYLQFIAWLISGLFTRNYNLKYLLLGCFFILSLHAYITPYVAINFGYWAMISIRASQGLFHAALFPIAYDILVRWTPYNEICRSVTMIETAKYFGRFILYLMVEFLHTNPKGWYTLFFLTGNFGFLWCVAWVVFGFDDPKNCFYITEKEKTYINTLSFHGAFASKGNGVATNHVPTLPHLPAYVPKKSTPRTPWADIMKCAPFHGLILTDTMYYWFLTFISESETIVLYVSSVHQYSDLAQISVVTRVSPVVLPILQYIAAFVADYFTGKDIFPIVYMRKTCNSIGLWGGAIFTIYMAYSPDPVFQLVMYTLIIYSSVFANLGMLLTLYDIAPNFVGLLAGISGFISRVPIAFMGLIVVYILPDRKSREDAGYDDFFYWGALSMFTGNFIYIMLVTDDIQSFNFEDKDTDLRDRSVSV